MSKRDIKSNLFNSQLLCAQHNDCVMRCELCTYSQTDFVYLSVDEYMAYVNEYFQQTFKIFNFENWMQWKKGNDNQFEKRICLYVCMYCCKSMRWNCSAFFRVLNEYLTLTVFLINRIFFCFHLFIEINLWYILL